MGTSEKFDNGLQVRREVLGEEYVDKSLSEATELTFPFQEEIIEVFLQTAIYCGVPAAVESVKIAKAVFEEFK